jgi:hypothetical protein
MCIASKELVCHGVTNRFGEADHITQLFLCVCRIRQVDRLGVDFVPERETRMMLMSTVLPVRRWRGISQSSAGLARWFIMNMT